MTENVLTLIDGGVGRIRLDRPTAINALTASMCTTILSALAAWRDDPAIEAVLIDHVAGRGFCAGGDVRMVAESAAKDGSEAQGFFLSQYRMNHRLFTFEKPIVAFMDGITMGGGVGLALPASYRIATENTKLAMPEAAIGLFADVGGGWYLSRLPGRIGRYLALSGYRLDGAECLRLGLATHYVTSDRLDEAKSRITLAPGDIETILAELASPVPDAAIHAHETDIDELFASDRLEDIYTALQAADSDWAASTLATLHTKSPQAMKVSLRLLKESEARLDFAAEMAQEYAVVVHVIGRHDFLEGVRAVIIDKDNAPLWDPSTPEGVTDDVIDAIFSALPPEMAWSPA